MAGDHTSEGFQVTGQAPDAKASPDLGSFDEQTMDLVLNKLCDAFELSRPAHKTLDAVIETVQESLSTLVDTNRVLAEGAERHAEQNYPLGQVVPPPGPLPQPYVAPEALSKGADPDDLEIVAQADKNLDLLLAPAAVEIRGVCLDLAAFLIEKNSRYGNSALDPLRILSRSNPLEQIRVRMDDKLSRLMRGEGAGPEASEDAIKDLVGYWVLLQVAENAHEKSGKNGSE